MLDSRGLKEDQMEIMRCTVSTVLVPPEVRS
jgi:hypothetical protein